MNIDYQVSINEMMDLDVTYVDANFNMCSVSMVGPFCVGYNHILQRFQQDRNLNGPDEVFTTKAYRDQCFKDYMRSCQDNYRYRWGTWTAQARNCTWRCMKPMWTTMSISANTWTAAVPS